MNRVHETKNGKFTNKTLSEPLQKEFNREIAQY